MFYDNVFEKGKRFIKEIVSTTLPHNLEGLRRFDVYKGTFLLLEFFFKFLSDVSCHMFQMHCYTRVFT